jgi:A/G-specific adenine glycosylase
MTIAQFQKIILDWHKENRRDLPWRNTKNPYKILVSEVLLQQTQISRVLPKYGEFLEAFPTLEALAKAPDKKLLKVWQGLGYWRRAKYLKETAKILTKARESSSQASSRRPASKVPKGVAGRERRPQNSTGNFEGRSLGTWTPERLEELPGVGPYTARALACFAFGSRETFLDTNIRRVYLHFFFPNQRDVPDEAILPLAQKAIYYVSHGRGNRTISPREWHYALFDYGALVLKDKGINKRSRHYSKQSKFAGSFRSYRTKVVHYLLSQKGNKERRAVIKELLKNSPYPLQEIINSLLKDGLIKKSGAHYSL